MGCIMLLLVFLCLAAVPRGHAAAEEPKVFVLSIPVGLGKHGQHLPRCSYDDPAVWEKNTNVVTDSGQDGYKVVPHYTMQYAGPWYLHQALAASSYITQDMAKADLIYIDWHCYYLRFWSLYYKEHKTTDAALFMRAALSAIKATDRWKTNNGTDFVFYLQCPTLTWLLDDCELNGMFIGHERAMICSNTRTMTPPNLVLAPYSSTTGSTRYAPPIKLRTLLLFFSAACQGPQSDGPKVGKQMRSIFVQTLNNETLKNSVLPHKVEVQCSCHNCPTRIAHDKQMAMLRRSIFCLVLPGDTQSSRRITEVMLSGCIPVFVLSPLHTLPFAQFVTYQKFSIFFRLTDVSAWLQPGRPEYKRWLPDTVVKSAIDVPTVADILRTLSGMVNSDWDHIHAMQQEVMRFRPFFKFSGMLGKASGGYGPEDAILESIFTMQRNRIRTHVSRK